MKRWRRRGGGIRKKSYWNLISRKEKEGEEGNKIDVIPDYSDWQKRLLPRKRNGGGREKKVSILQFCGGKKKREEKEL